MRVFICYHSRSTARRQDTLARIARSTYIFLSGGELFNFVLERGHLYSTHVGYRTYAIYAVLSDVDAVEMKLRFEDAVNIESFIPSSMKPRP
jgi:hypothetical protein